MHVHAVDKDRHWLRAVPNCSGADAHRAPVLPDKKPCRSLAPAAKILNLIGATIDVDIFPKATFDTAAPAMHPHGAMSTQTRSVANMGHPKGAMPTQPVKAATEPTEAPKNPK